MILIKISTLTFLLQASLWAQSRKAEVGSQVRICSDEDKLLREPAFWKLKGSSGFIYFNKSSAYSLDIAKKSKKKLFTIGAGAALFPLSRDSLDTIAIRLPQKLEDKCDLAKFEIVKFDRKSAKPKRLKTVSLEKLLLQKTLTRYMTGSRELFI